MARLLGSLVLTNLAAPTDGSPDRTEFAGRTRFRGGSYAFQIRLGQFPAGYQVYGYVGQRTHKAPSESCQPSHRIQPGLNAFLQTNHRILDADL